MNLEIRLETGTAYDFFISLFVLNNPVIFGLRPSWAKGVRARLPVRQREVIEKAQTFLPVPLSWLHSLPPGQNNAAQALVSLRTVPASERIKRLSLRSEMPSRVRETLYEIAERGSAEPADLEVLFEDLRRWHSQTSSDALANMVAAWSRPAEFGESYLDALESYQQAFFFQEEERIKPFLEAARAQAEALADELPRAELLEKLSRGVMIEEWYSAPTIVLVPSFWSSPLILFTRLDPRQTLLVFGCRPENQTLVPGDPVPRDMLVTFKALGDSTRLRILRYLANEPLTPRQLAERLRLRPPTVVHHLNSLRLAGLVGIEMQADGEKRYVLRRAGLENICNNLNEFLAQPAVFSKRT